MKTYPVDGKTICVPGQRTFDRDDFNTDRPIYVATGYVQGEREEPHTWRLLWYGSGLTSRVEPPPNSKPYQAVEISTGKVVPL